MFIHFHIIHLLLRQANAFRIYAENFHPGGLRKWQAPQLSEIHSQLRFTNVL